MVEGFTWREGRVWAREGGFLLFSDMSENKIYRSREGNGRF